MLVLRIARPARAGTVPGMPTQPDSDSPMGELEAWIRDMPAGQWVPEDWADGPMVRVEVLDYDYGADAALLWRLVARAYPADADGTMSVPELIAACLEWYGGEDAGFVAQRV